MGDPGTERRRPTGHRSGGWVVLAVVSAVANLNFLLRFVVPATRPAPTEVSGFSVPGAPHAWVFRTGDLVYGLAAALLGTGVLRRPGRWTREGHGRRRAGRPARVLGWSLVVFGLANAVAAVVPEGSADATTVGDALASPSGIGHGAASLVAGAAQVVAVLAAAVGAASAGATTARTTTAGGTAAGGGRERRGRAGRVAALVAWWVAAVLLTAVAGAETLSAAGAGFPVGLVQRAGLVLTSVWLVAVGAAVTRSGRRVGPVHMLAA